MPKTPLVDRLEQEAEHLYILIASAEPWSKSYEQDSETHARIIKHEAKLERAMRRYFRGFKDRLDNYILWSTYRQKTMKAYDVNATINADNFDEEDSILISIVLDPIAEGIAIGAQAGESIYNTPMGLDTYSKAVLDAARKRSSELVTQIDATTLDYLQSSLETSIKLGETTDQARQRILDRITDPNRAATIARTESVRAYQEGMLVFGQESQAVGKEWQAIEGGCQICAPMDGQQVGIDESFDSGDDSPPAHPNCRCGMRLIYQEELDGMAPPDGGDVSFDES